MSTPNAFDRVNALLQRLQPPGRYSGEPGSAVVRELAVIAWIVARGVDVFEAMLPALFLETTAIVERWEGVLKLGVHSSEPLGVRAGRIISVMRRRVGYSRDALANVLAPLLGVDASDLEWIEVFRSEIDEALTVEWAWNPGRAVPAIVGGYGYAQLIDVGWPSRVDDTGLTLKVGMSVANAADVTIQVLHASGRSWTAWNRQAGSLTNKVLACRDVFRGRLARGPWTIRISTTGMSGAAILTRLALTVSNDDTARQIYYGWCLRDIDRFGPIDVRPAQMAIERSGIGHTRAIVCERNALLCDDAHSLCDREPIGG